MGGIAGLGGAAFGLIWTILALSIGAPPLFAGFGVIFIALNVGSAIYQFKNATGKKRYSEWDIVDSSEESDPLNEYFGGQDADESAQPADGDRQDFAFCPYCGQKLDAGDNFCGKCGRRIR